MEPTCVEMNISGVRLMIAALGSSDKVKNFLDYLLVKVWNAGVEEGKRIANEKA